MLYAKKGKVRGLLLEPKYRGFGPVPWIDRSRPTNVYFRISVDNAPVSHLKQCGVQFRLKSPHTNGLSATLADLHSKDPFRSVRLPVTQSITPIIHSTTSYLAIISPNLPQFPDIYIFPHPFPNHVNISGASPRQARN